MSIQTQSAFRYGIEITEDNRFFDFEDENGKHSMQLPMGQYCPSELPGVFLKIFATLGFADYNVLFDQYTCLIKIFRSSVMPFDILTNTGANAANGVYSLINLDTSADLIGAIEYQSNMQVGKKFIPQFLLQDYVDCDQNKRLRQASKNESSTGDCCEILHCGLDQYFEFEIKAQTNIPQGHRLVRPAMGYDEIKQFLDWAICGKPIEFFPDCTEVTKPYKIKLSKTRNSKNGTGYRLYEMNRTLGCGYFRTGKLEFRVLDKPQ